jgi:hypothetical protein
MPDRAPTATPDRAAAFAEVSQAVDTVAGPSPNTPPPSLSEDLLPQRLPKRGRRSSRLGAPWSREKPARPPVAPRPAPAVAHDVPAPPPAPVNADAHGRIVGPPATQTAPSTGALHFPPGGPAFPAPPAREPVADENGAASEPKPASTDGENRFAFFAAFRAAAEQAREEAGIDNRRMGQ